MKSITIHGMDDLLTAKIESLSKEKQLSLNKTIKHLLAIALGITSSKKKSDFSDVIGVWSKEEFENFSQTQESFSRIDPKDWE